MRKFLIVLFLSKPLTFTEHYLNHRNTFILQIKTVLSSKILPNSDDDRVILVDLNEGKKYLLYFAEYP